MSISLYIHIPYCVKKCPYCDFNSYGVGKEQFPEESYTSAILSELSHYSAREDWQNQNCETIFFGGGTPSLFSAHSISAIISEIDRLFPLLENCEITLEANPGTVQELLGREKLSSFFKTGVNRLSFGAQSFSNEKLKQLGRLHSPKDIVTAVENGFAAGFTNINLDLMFGVVGETLKDWQRDLREVLALRPEHISAYGLTIEAGTEFYREHQRGIQLQVEEELSAAMFKSTQETLGDAGYEQYEISNYAKPGRECRHNLAYWTGKKYLGLGAGAHSYDGKSRWWNIPGPEHYIERANELGTAVQKTETLSAETTQTEFWFLGLRTRKGVSLAEHQQHFGEPLLETHEALLKQLEREDLIERDSLHVRLSKKGFLFADSIISEFQGKN